jgi:magnesium transporter
LFLVSIALDGLFLTAGPFFTFFIGLWGMNFANMPELQKENGYYFALSGMAAVALTLLLIFYRYGWFN